MSEYFRKYVKKEHYPVSIADLKFKTYFTNCIQSSLLAREYRQTQGDDWDIYWCEKHLINETLDRIRLHPNKRINHFRNYYELCRKDLLSKNIKRHRKALQKEDRSEEAIAYSFVPLTYTLPSEYPIFYEEYKRCKDKEKPVWIMKPISLSQGKGIFLFKSIGDIEEWSEVKSQPEPYIVQRYIHNPLLIGHKKFDLRIYVLVTSFNPLTIYLYRSGFGRFTHYRYDSGDISSIESHLTNVAIQKNCNNYDQEKGGKYQLNKLKHYFLGKFGQESTNVCFYQIQQLIIRTLQAVSKLMNTDKRCFELYGFDILIDLNLKPWLIEVNGSPSMTANTDIDKQLKAGLLDDVLTIVNVQQLLAGDEQRVGGFDLIYKNTKTSKKNLSMLGCVNDRLPQMRKLAKMVALRLAEKPKKQEQSIPRPKNLYGITRANIAQSLKAKMTNPKQIKLPRVGGGISSKLIDNPKKANQIFRITKSKQGGRV